MWEKYFANVNDVFWAFYDLERTSSATDAKSVNVWSWEVLESSAEFACR